METRWNSLYDYLTQILSTKQKMYDLQVALKTNAKYSFSENDFINVEHIKETKPIACTINIMQGETNTFYGIFIPCIVALRRQLQELAKENWVFCKPLVDGLLNSIEKRFQEFFVFSTEISIDAAIAALSYPRFKNKWLACYSKDTQERILQIPEI